MDYIPDPAGWYKEDLEFARLLRAAEDVGRARGWFVCACHAVDAVNVGILHNHNGPLPELVWWMLTKFVIEDFEVGYETCDECGAKVSLITGCLFGREICQRCSDAGIR
jgi:hypothetical protein